MDYRKKGLNAITKYITIAKRAKEFEDKLYQKVILTYKDTDYESGYNTLLYFYLSLLKNKKLIELDDDIWDSDVYSEVKKIQHEKDDFISNPFVVEEGAITCDKCKSNRTYSYSKQVRSADEGFTTFVTCANCNAKWRIN
jgi:DNA-directed RNA polymerase subunit M/transcription elongation factor TFIIS